MKTLAPRTWQQAREALGWSRVRLGSHANVSPETIARMEAGEPALPSTAAKVRAALEAAGVEFTATNDNGPGVRLRKAGAG